MCIIRQLLVAITLLMVPLVRGRHYLTATGEGCNGNLCQRGTRIPLESLQELKFYHQPGSKSTATKSVKVIDRRASEPRPLRLRTKLHRPQGLTGGGIIISSRPSPNQLIQQRQANIEFIQELQTTTPPPLPSIAIVPQVPAQEFVAANVEFFEAGPDNLNFEEDPEGDLEEAIDYVASDPVEVHQTPTFAQEATSSLQDIIENLSSLSVFDETNMISPMFTAGEVVDFYDSSQEEPERVEASENATPTKGTDPEVPTAAVELFELDQTRRPSVAFFNDAELPGAPIMQSDEDQEYDEPLPQEEEPSEADQESAPLVETQSEPVRQTPFNLGPTQNTCPSHCACVCSNPEPTPTHVSSFSGSSNVAKNDTGIHFSLYPCSQTAAYRLHVALRLCR